MPDLKNFQNKRIKNCLDLYKTQKRNTISQTDKQTDQQYRQTRKRKNRRLVGGSFTSRTVRLTDMVSM